MDLIDAFWQQFRLELHERESSPDVLFALLDLAKHLWVMLQHSLSAEVPLLLISISFDLEDASEMQL
ncbi:hypothetical protein PMIT1313_01140 [Prochlorococcus marinus str. MIT 1313]|uniref:hypothetical protein n=1 Tax=Prochlorococcus TaxID=1218 RepID=UPI0007B3445F|nr:hypothetical protein PMIT1313_01140 [Prochlorococcus marinus str. MIT 1313]KZR72601.1 hypothetical protein PMIT1318_01116 [Prochlorococcus marinus str. MIT 1318]